MVCVCLLLIYMISVSIRCGSQEGLSFIPLGAWPGLGTQPHDEAPGEPMVEIDKTKWLTSG